MSVTVLLLGFVTAVLGLAATVLGLLNQRRIRGTARDVQSISVQVDGRLSTLLERQAQLLGTLNEHGVPVPPRPPEP